MKSSMITITFVLGFMVPIAAAAAEPPAYEFRYHNYAESTALLENLVASYPRLAKLYSLGKTATGTKEIWCIEIGNQETGAGEDKPAAYFDGNQHSSEVMGGEVTLYLAYYLLTQHGKNPDVTELVDTRVIYIVQRADPDGAEAFMTGEIDWDRENVPGATDADGDGKKGEDGPEDIDGDGEILKIRIVDSEGQWKAYEGDSRIMVEREEDDEKGPFFRVLDEGIDNDGDGEVNEDPPFTRFISNRNYPAFWVTPDARFRGAGDYPFQEHNTRILADFILSKPHISQFESYHTTSGIHLRPYAARPDTDLPPRDLQDYIAVLSKGTEITSYPVASIYHDFSTIEPGLPPDEQPGVRHGGSIDWTYQHLGIFSVATELWSMEPFVNEVGWGDIPREKYLFTIPGRYRRPDVQAAVLEWLDRHKGIDDLSGQGFIDWKPYPHPTLGEVEIGGFTRYWLRNPPPGPFFEKIAVDQAKFSVVQVLTTPLVKIQKVEVDIEESKMWKITATIANEGYLDTSMQQGRIAGVAKPDELFLELPEAATTKNPRTVEFPFLRGTRGSSYVSLYRATWVVEAPEDTKITVVARSEKGGTDRREVSLSAH